MSFIVLGMEILCGDNLNLWGGEKSPSSVKIGSKHQTKTQIKLLALLLLVLVLSFD